MEKVNSIWNWDLWHEMKGTKNTIVKDSKIMSEIKDRLKKGEDKPCKKNSNDDEKDQAI